MTIISHRPQPPAFYKEQLRGLTACRISRSKGTTAGDWVAFGDRLIDAEYEAAPGSQNPATGRRHLNP